MDQRLARLWPLVRQEVQELMDPPKDMTRQIIEALAYLHGTSADKKIVHQDTKPSNIFFKVDAEDGHEAAAEGRKGATEHLQQKRSRSRSGAQRSASPLSWTL